MNIKNHVTRILCGAGLALTLVAVPAAWALSPAPKTPQSSSMSSMQMGQVDINTASVNQLKAIPGVGDTYAKRIIQNRPYSSKDQLVTKGVLPQGVYNKIKNRIVAHRTKK